MKRKHITTIEIWLCVAAALSLCCAYGCLAAAPSYTDQMSSAITALQDGKTADCVQALRGVLQANPNDALAHSVFGMALLCGRRSADALTEFGAALTADKNCAQAMYGKGLVHLRDGRLDFAALAFKQAQQMNAAINTASELAYVDGIKSGTYKSIDSPNKDAVAQAIDAVCLMSQRKLAQASDAWRKLLPERDADCIRERFGCGVTFLRSSPIAVGGEVLQRYEPVTPVAAKPKQDAVSGTISIKADLSKAQTVKLVTFYVDDKVVGITNRPPFSYEWNTARVSNGVHTIRIVGTDEDCATVSEKTAQVTICNESAPAPSVPVASSDIDALWTKLWGVMKLQTSVAAANFNLAVCYSGTGKPADSKYALERVVAVNPDYLDAANRLAGIYEPTGAPQMVDRVQTDKKLIALTFDDGPRPIASQLLDVLDQKNVKASFFIVGKMAVAEPGIVSRMVKSGHDVASHTYDHIDLRDLSVEEIEKEIFSNISLIRTETGKECRFLRPPGGEQSSALQGVLKKFGLTCVMWTASSSSLEGKEPQKMAEYVVGAAKPGAIIQMHSAEPTTINALPTIIDKLRGEGYQFVTISELVTGGKNSCALQAGKPVP